MNKYEKAFNCVCQGTQLNEVGQEDCEEEINEALKIIEELIVKSVTKELLGDCKCPVCGFTSFYYDEFVHYCSYCGQKIFNEDSE